MPSQFLARDAPCAELASVDEKKGHHPRPALRNEGPPGIGSGFDHLKLVRELHPDLGEAIESVLTQRTSFGDNQGESRDRHDPKRLATGCEGLVKVFTFFALISRGAGSMLA